MTSLSLPNSAILTIFLKITLFKYHDCDGYSANRRIELSKHEMCVICRMHFCTCVLSCTYHLFIIMLWIQGCALRALY